MAARLAASLVALALVSQACHKTPSADQFPEPSGTGTQNETGSMESKAGPNTTQPDAAQIAIGEKIFHGQAAGGTCAGCHGAKGKGTGVAPNLADTDWLNTDGSMEGIVKVINEGVAKPIKSSGPMPAKGGAKLTDEQVQQVAAYVYSLSHK